MTEGREEIKETYIEWHPFLKKWGWLIYFFVIMIGFDLLTRKHENSYGGNKFVLFLGIAGFVAGLFVFGLLRLIYTQWSFSKMKSGEIAYYIVLGTIVVFIGLGPVINEATAKQAAQCSEFRIEEIGHNYGTNSHYLHVHTKRGSERFEPPTSFMNKLTANDSIVILCIRKGGLGYEYVEEFRIR